MYESKSFNFSVPANNDVSYTLNIAKNGYKPINAATGNNGWTGLVVECNRIMNNTYFEVLFYNTKGSTASGSCAYTVVYIKDFPTS